MENLKNAIYAYNGLHINRYFGKRVMFSVTRFYRTWVMLTWLTHPAHIFGLVQMQSKRNPSVQNGIPRNSVSEKSSYVQYTLDITWLFEKWVICICSNSKRIATRVAENPHFKSKILYKLLFSFLNLTFIFRRTLRCVTTLLYHIFLFNWYYIWL